MALTTEPRPLGYAKSYSQSAPLMKGAEKASSTWKAGAILIDDDAGLLTEATTPVSDSAATEAKRALGLALSAATGVTSAEVIMVDAKQGIFEGTLSDSTAGTHTLAQTDQWKIYPLLKTASGNWYLDANAVSDVGGAMITGFKDDIGTVDGRVFFKFAAVVGGANDGSPLL